MVGESLMARPSLAELARALEAARHRRCERTHPRRQLSPPDLTAAWLDCARPLQTHSAEFSVSPGRNWLAMQLEDFDAAVRLRRQALRLGADIEAGRLHSRPTATRWPAQIRAEVETPAWRAFTVAAAGAKAGRRAIRTDHQECDLQGDPLTLLALLDTGWAITWPVRRLTAGTRRLAAGDLATRVARGGARELDELANAFNHMANELADAERAVKTHQAHLEHRVEERTLQLRHLAEHDPLTNLPNRRQLFQRLNAMLDAARPAGHGGIARCGAVPGRRQLQDGQRHAGP